MILNDEPVITAVISGLSCVKNDKTSGVSTNKTLKTGQFRLYRSEQHTNSNNNIHNIECKESEAKPEVKVPLQNTGAGYFF